MPGLDRGGPMGDGPMNGRGRGFCNTLNTGNSKRFVGGSYGQGSKRCFGLGMGMRHGFCWGYSWHVPLLHSETPEEIDVLRSQAESIKSVLNDLQERIKNLETSSNVGNRNTC